MLVANSDVVALVKPQFEAGRDQVGKKGIVRDPKIHKEVLNKIITFPESQGYDIVMLSFSPITGGDGNIEFLFILAGKVEAKGRKLFLSKRLMKSYREAHINLKKNKLYSFSYNG